MFTYTHEYYLDKNHFSECFDQSASSNKGLKAYYKAIALFILAAVLMLSNATYEAFFLLCLSAIAFIATYHQKTLWLWRQMISKAYAKKVSITVNEEGLETKSVYINSMIHWAEVVTIKQTEKGLLIKHPKGVNYVSNSVLSDEALEFILNKSH